MPHDANILNVSMSLSPCASITIGEDNECLGSAECGPSP